MSTESKSSIIGSVLGWLRAGYPQGVPRGDYVALYAVLHRKLTDLEVHRIAVELTAERAEAEGTAPIDRAEIETAIARSAKEQPGADDVARVEAHLAAGGWPVADTTATDGS